jgi:hypothetical protein
MAAKVAIFNDTTAERHFGCDAVMATLRREIAARGGAIVHSHPVGSDWRKSRRARTAIASADIVIVNGEGTVHHSKERARALAAIGPYAAEQHKPAFLINATIEANDAATMADILAFRRIWVRDTKSADEIRRTGGTAGVAPDLSFGQHFAPASGGRGVIVVDGVLRRARKRLADAADTMGTEYLSIRHSPGPAYIRVGPPWRRRYSWRWLGFRLRFPDTSAYAHYLGQHDHMVTGRYHAVCLAISLGLSFSALGSNTSKIQSLLADVGLNEDRMIGERDAPPIVPFSAEEKERAEAFTKHARTAHQSMFDELFGLV